MINRIKHLSQLIALGLCVLFISISHAQSETWWAWTYDDLNGEMIWLDSTGFTRKSVILPKPAGYETYTYTYQVAVAPTGDRVAYTLAGMNNEIVLVVYHLMNDYVMMTYSLPTVIGMYVEHSLNYNAMPTIFTTDGRYLAFAYRVENTWGMYVFDTQTNGVSAYSLFNSAPNAPAIGAFELPVPVYLTPDTLHFTVVGVGDMGIGQPSYALNYMTGVVMPTTHFPTVAVSIEPRTGEIIYPTLDTRFANRSQQIQGIGAHLNSVQVYAPSMANYPFPFFVDEINTIDNAYFIQNGDLIMLRTTEIDGDSYGNHIMIDRAGNRRGILPYQSLWFYPVFSVGEGFVFMSATADLASYFPTLQNANSTALVFVDTTQGIDGNIGRVIYTGISGTGARLAWASDITNRLAPNPNSWIEVFPTTLGNPPVMPSVNSGLYVGAQARVTLKGDGLNVRQIPSVNGIQIAQLVALDLMNIIGGPQYADGLTWWQMDNGIINGWVADGMNDELWLEVYTGTLPPPPDATAPSAPSLINPQDNDYFADFTLRSGNVVLPPIFEWVGVASANQYAVEFQRCMGVCEWVIAFYTPLTSYAVDITQFGFGQFRWRVVPLDVNNNQGTPSEWRYFTYGN